MIAHIFKSNFNIQFNAFKEQFIEDCILKFDVINNDHYAKILLYYNFSNGKNLLIDRKYAIGVIQATILHDKNPEYINNNIVFRKKGSYDIEFDEPFMTGYKKMEDDLLKAFYEDKSNISLTEELFKFPCYKEQIVSQAKGDENLFNGIGWQQFMVKLFTKLYPTFRPIPTKSNVTFIRELNEKMSFGFQIDVNEFRRELKRYGWPTIPEKKFVLISKDKEMTVSDCDFHHPFFKTISSLFSYIGSDYMKMHSDGSVQFLATAERELLVDGRVRLFQSEERGLDYKKYAFFKMLMSSDVDNSYFNFLESILATISDEYW